MKQSCKKMKGMCWLVLGAALVIPIFSAGYLYVRNATLEKELQSICKRIEMSDQEALLRAAIAVVTEGKPHQYEEALANAKLPYAMQEIEERLESLSSVNNIAADLVYVRQVAQNFKGLEKSCATLLRNY